MSIPVFEVISNNLLLPTPNGAGVEVVLGDYVKGTYYTFFSTIGWLEDVTDEGIPDVLIKYTYPESTSNGDDPIGTITEVVAGTGLTGGGTSGSVTLSLAAGEILASNIASGQVVKSLNTFKDTISILPGTGIGIVNDTNTITISNSYPGLTVTSGTLPLTLTLSNSNQTLSGSIAITPTNDGGAVAKQSTLPLTYQTGKIGLTGDIYLSPGSLYINSEDNDNKNSYLAVTTLPSETKNIFEVFNSEATSFIDPLTNLVFKLDKNGSLYSKNLLTKGTLTLTSEADENLITLTPVDTLAHSYFNIYSNTRFYNNVDISNGQILGTVADKPLILLKNNSSTIPAIKIYSDSPGIDNVLEVVDDTDTVTAKLTSDGKLSVTALEAGILRSNFIYINSPQTYNVTLNGPQYVIGDCSPGTIIVQLPDLTADFDEETISITAKKVDLSSNALSIVPGTGNYLEGSLNSINLVTQYSSITVIGVLIGATRHWFKIAEI